MPGTSARQSLDLSTLDIADDSRLDPMQAAQRQEEREHVLELLRSLPTEYREPLMLRYIGGADYETISRQLGLSNGSLRGLLNRGMARLREGMNALRQPRTLNLAEDTESQRAQRRNSKE
jgi:RNA polymerase sigma factor (sigma-70 family)